MRDLTSYTYCDYKLVTVSYMTPWHLDCRTEAATVSDEIKAKFCSHRRRDKHDLLGNSDDAVPARRANIANQSDRVAHDEFVVRTSNTISLPRCCLATSGNSDVSARAYFRFRDLSRCRARDPIRSGIPDDARNYVEHIVSGTSRRTADIVFRISNK